MSDLPSGTVTFLFTDIEGSTRLFQEHPVAMKDALARHNTLLQRTIGAHRGHVFHMLGDGFCSVFEHPGDAFAAALAAQRALHEEDWGEVGAVRVRMGLHTGGDFHAALAWYEQYVPLVRDTENGVARLLILPSAAEAFLRAGRIAEATRLAGQATTVAEFARAPHRLALIRRVQGQILAVQNDRDGALCAFDDAIATFTPLGSRLELARAEYHRAALRLARGDPPEREAARAEATRARDAFAQMGAVHDRVLAEQLLK